MDNKIREINNKIFTYREVINSKEFESICQSMMRDYNRDYGVFDTVLFNKSELANIYRNFISANMSNLHIFMHIDLNKEDTYENIVRLINYSRNDLKSLREDENKLKSLQKSISNLASALEEKIFLSDVNNFRVSNQSRPKPSQVRPSTIEWIVFLGRYCTSLINTLEKSNIEVILEKKLSSIERELRALKEAVKNIDGKTAKVQTFSY